MQELWVNKPKLSKTEMRRPLPENLKDAVDARFKAKEKKMEKSRKEEMGVRAPELTGSISILSQGAAGCGGAF